MGKSIVYFQEVTNSKDKVLLKSKFKQLIKETKLCEMARKGELIPIKLHMGEKGNTGHVDAAVIKALVDALKSKAAKPFITDTNVLYQGRRVNTVDHLMLASEHGFDIQTLGAPVIITDGILGENFTDVRIDKKHFKTITVAKPVTYFDFLISATHVTGHLLTGFAGSIKNIGMGLASRAGKLKQHSNIKPRVIENNCVLCRKCIEHCPAQAISEQNEHALINPQICLGCAECIIACKFGAIADDYGENAKIMTEKMVEYAYGILLNMKRKMFFNFAVHITRNCDCLAKDEPSIIEDLGIFASIDPVACDKAVADMVLKKAQGDVFKKAYPQADFYMYQLLYAAEIGLGNLEYELIYLS